MARIKEIASSLPEMRYEYISGYEKATNSKGRMTITPVIAVNDVNHERRLRRAFKRNGNDGARAYLNMVYARLRDAKG